MVAGVRLPFVQAVYGRAHLQFELHALFVFLLLALYAGRKLWKREPSLARWTVVLLPCLVLASHLTLHDEFSAPSYDYKAYEQAARRLVAGEPIYDLDIRGNDFGYLYPPLLARSLALAHGALRALPGEIDPWDRVFFAFQAVSLAALALAFYLFYRLLRRLHLSQIEGVVAASVAFGLNGLLVRNFAYNQVNLFVLDSYLLAALLAVRRPGAAGLALSAGLHLKLWPVTLLPQWLAERRWRALFAAGAGTALLGAALSLGPRAGETWRDLALLMRHFPTSLSFRDNSLHAVVANVLRHAASDAVSTALAKGLAALAAALLLARCYRRRRRTATLPAGRTVLNLAGRELPEAEASRLLTSADLIALPLLVSPITWEHHYLLALPLAAAALALADRGRLPRAALGAALVFLPPIFNVFPLGFHRLLGLGVLFFSTPPAGGGGEGATAPGPAESP